MLKAADADFLEALAPLVPAGTLRPAEARHLAEPRGRWRGQAGAVALPRTTAEVSAILAACAAAGVGVVPISGGTGLVGGQVAPEGPAPLVLSTERMAAIRAVDPAAGTITAEAGVVLAALQDAAAAAGRLFPLSLASEGSARLGGLLATNAGGVNVLRWGNTRDLCLGIEAVFADGSVLHGLTGLRKDNAGYDLRHLLIGSEGTLAVITAAVMRLVPRPAESVAAFLAVPDPAAALALLRIAEEVAPGAVSAFELIDGTGLGFLRATMPEVVQPLDPIPRWAVLVDLGLPAGADGEGLLGRLWAAAEAAGLATDGVIATAPARRAALWRLRESIPEGNRRVGAIASHDISVPVSRLPGFIARATRRVASFGPLRVNCFGHLGDGNLHFNVFPPEGDGAGRSAGPEISRAIHDLVHETGGSIAAEHGLGRLKAAEFERYGDPAKLRAMRAIKAALDPAGILNPGAVLRRP
jgi:FAD/FMN-containing dehydrogenase